METLIDTVLSKINVNIPTLRKYVDDLVLLVPSDRVAEILDAFNSYHHKIQFTYELEQDGRLPYLDMTLIRQADNTIRTQWYTKPIASGRLLNFKSVHPMSQKINIVRNFIDRVHMLSTNSDEAEKRQIITKHLLANDYPRSLINRCLNRTDWSRQSDPVDSEESSEDEPIYRSLPYIPTLTPRIIHLLRKAHPTVAVTSRSDNTLSKLHTRIKDPIPTNNHHNVVYRLQCEDCDSSYVGMTRNLLKTRLSGHRSNVNKLDSFLHSGLTYTDERVQALKETSALLSHCIDHDHRFDLSHPKILDRTNKRSSLPLLEMIWIQNDRKSVNKRTDTEGLNSTFAGILHTIDTQRTRLNREQLHTQSH